MWILGQMSKVWNRMKRLQKQEQRQEQKMTVCVLLTESPPPLSTKYFRRKGITYTFEEGTPFSAILERVRRTQRLDRSTTFSCLSNKRLLPLDPPSLEPNSGVLYIHALQKDLLPIILTRLNSLEEGIKQIARFLEFQTKLEIEEWKNHSEDYGKDEDFKKAVMEYYCDDDSDHNLLCMVTGLRLPCEDVVAAHIISRKHRRRARVYLDMHDLNDPKNGIMWSSPVEEAWLNHKICFSYCHDQDTYRLHLLDAQLQAVELRTYTTNLSTSMKQALGSLTFGDLNGSLMHFRHGVPARPYKRAFCHMSGLMRKWAQQEGMIPTFIATDYNFEYWLEEEDKSHVSAWLNHLPIHCEEASQDNNFDTQGGTGH